MSIKLLLFARRNNILLGPFALVLCHWLLRVQVKLEDLLSLEHSVLVGCLLLSHIASKLLKLRLQCPELLTHLILPLVLLSHDISVLILLICYILHNFAVLIVSQIQTILSVVSELFYQLKSLYGLCFDFTVVTLHHFQICAKLAQLRIEQVFQEGNILALSWILIKNFLNFLELHGVLGKWNLWLA